VAPDHRTRSIAVCIAITVLLGCGLIGAVLTSIHNLPVLIHGLNTSAMTRVTAPVGVPLVILSVLLAARGLRERTGPERWTSVSIYVCLADLVLTYTSHYRYSAGWYAGRGMTVLAAGLVLVAMLAQGTRAHRDNERLAEFYATHDPLTGLGNKRAAQEHADRMFAHAQRTGEALSVIMIDIDHFKTINDRYGHRAGDDVLVATAALLRSRLRASDVAARVGGEEFLVFLPDTARDGAAKVAEDLRRATTAMLCPYAGPAITISLGLASLIPGQDEISDLLDLADQAMYEAKRAGRNRIVIHAACLDVPTAPASPRAAQQRSHAH
jgi:diguanylate cyclase (GGDEF)-like protein